MKKKIVFIAAACVVLILLGGLNTVVLYSTEYLSTKSGYTYSVSAYVSWWDCNWSYCKKIIIDHTKVQADQTNFPVLLYRAADAELSAYAQSDGNDIVFVDRYNITQYKHEIEKYVSGTGELVVWVNVTSVSSTEDTILYMYYGNPDCGNQQDVTATWDSNYVLIQHLNETAGTLYDSTSNNNDGINNGADYNASSKIDGGYDFDGSDYVLCNTSDSLNVTTQITLEGWVKDPPTTTKTDIRIIDKREEQKTITPGRQLTVKRTITTDAPTNITFIALYSPGIKIKSMTTENNPILTGIYRAGEPQTEEENNIEKIRKTLPTELKNLDTIAYSRTFEITQKNIIQMQFEPEKQLNIFPNGRISYLVISNDGSYDFEGTTHWNSNLIPVNLFNLFSYFKNKKDVTPNFNSDEKYSTNINEEWPKTIDLRTPENSFGFVNDLINIEQLDLSNFWNFFDTCSKWRMDCYKTPQGKWVNVTDYLIVSDNKSIDGNLKTNLEFTAPYNGSYNISFTIDRPLKSYYNDSKHDTYYLNYTNEQNNETYHAFFNFSDIRAIGLFNITPEIINNKFKLSVRLDNVYAGFHIIIDPTFGVTTAYGNTNSIENRIRGIYAAPVSNGTAWYIMARLIVSNTAKNTKCALYAYTDYAVNYAGALIASTEQKSVPVGTNWVQFNFTAPGPSLTYNTNYYIVAWMTSAAGTGYLGGRAGAAAIDYNIGSYGAWPSPMVGEGASALTHSIYCFYNYSDAVAPRSSVSTITPYWKTTTPQTITGTATDNLGGSGVKNVTLWYRYRATNASSWGGWVSSGLIDTDPWISVSWSFTFSNGTGHYEFYSIAKDNATNTETPPGTADTKCGYDNQAPTSSVNAISPYWQKTSPLSITATASDTGSGLKNVTLYYRYTTYNSTDSPAGCLDWWNTNWLYRKQLNITNKNGGYQMKIIVGNSSGGNVTCNGHAKSDFGDIRFISSANTALSFWLRNYTANTQATFWVNNSLNDTSIWMYYGNSGASTTSNGSNTFYFFDDFSNGLSKWYMDSFNSDSIVIDSSLGNPTPSLKHLPDNSIPANRTYQDTRIRTKDYKILNGIIEYDVYLAGTPRIIHQFGWRVNGLPWTNGYAWRLQSSAADGGFFRFSAPITWKQIGTAFPLVSTGTWYHVKINVTGADYSAKITPSAPAGDSARSVTDSTKTTEDYLVSHVHGVSMDGTNYVLVDNVFVRKYWATPPTWGGFGSEKSGGWIKFGVDTTPWSGINWSFTFPNGTGYYQFCSIGIDNATEKELEPNTPDTKCGYDNVTPTSSVDAITPYWKKDTPLAITVTASDTGYSGLKNVTLYYYNSTNNVTWRGPWEFGSTNTTPWTTPIRWNFNFPNGTGYYRFYSIAADNATNIESAPVTNDTMCGYDNQEPTSSVNTISPYLQKNSPLIISATAIDNGPSGLKNVTLEYRYSTDNASWGGYASFGIDTTPWSGISWSFTFSNGTGYYEFYSIATDNATNVESAPGSADTICRYVTMPIVTTNTSTGVEETNATLWGYLKDDGGAIATVGFWWDTDSGTPYTNNQTIGVVNEGDTFNYNATGLNPGKLYYYRAWVNSIFGFNDTSNEKTLLTKPEPPANLHAQNNNSQTIYLTWTKGTGANNTYIERNATGQTIWARGTGTMIYNNTGTKYEDTGLHEGTTYYYQAWSYTTWATLNQYSDQNTSDYNTTNHIPTITNPYPTNGSAGIPITPTLNITVNDGDGDTMTIIWTSNSSGAWLEFGRNTSVGNGTYRQTNSNFSNPNTTYWWNVTVTDGIETNQSWYYFTTTTIPPTVTTNTSTGLEEINATLWGYLSNDGGGTTTVGFWWDTNSEVPYANNQTVGVANEGDTFSHNASSLTPGQIYYYRAWAKNIAGFNSTSNELTFLTKPNATTSFVAHTNSSSIIYLTWTKGTGANNTYIERNATGQTIWTRGTGTMIYNNTGTKYEDTGLHEGVTYYYQAWSYTAWSTFRQWSDDNASTYNTTNRIPLISNPAPPNGSTNIQITPWTNITINDPDGDTMTVIWYSNSSGAWLEYGRNNTATNGTYRYKNNNFSDYNTTYWWNVTVTDGMNANISGIYHFTTASGGTTVTTNTSTGIEETNATLWGYLANDGGEVTTVGFWWDTGTGTPYANNQTIGVVNEGDTFSYNASSLTPGQIYYYRAWAKNKNGFNSTANEKTLLTKPQPPTNLHAKTNNSQTIYLTWTKGNGANNTRIQRKTGSYPTSISDGTNVYNGTGTQYENTGLTQGTTYYYRAWSYATWNPHQWSDNNASDSNTTNHIPTITNPYPTNGSAGISEIPTLRITVNDGDGDTMTIIWTSNSSGAWLEFGRNTSIGNGTYRQANTNFSNPNTTYWWNITVTDGIETNQTWYYFTTTVIILSNENPTNASSNVPLNPTLSIKVNHSGGYQMNITWYWGTDSSCPDFIGTNSSVNNGTYYMNNDDNFSTYSQTYYWRVIVNDGEGSWTNATYQFTTEAANKRIIKKGQNAYSIEISPDGTILYGYINSNNVQTSIDTNWHYVTLTYDGSKIRLYKDGKLEDDADLNGNININANDLMLGEYLTGVLDEIRISKTARSAAWINTTYVNTNDPASFATFDQQQGVLSTFNYRKQIWVNSSMVDSDLSDFPVLISITDNDLKNNADTTGYDIIFTSSEINWKTGAFSDILPHEIEKWDKNTGELVCWVKLDISSSTNTSFYLYYNSICNSDKQDAENVWDDNYVGVWHINEGVTNSIVRDSTSNFGNSSVNTWTPNALSKVGPGGQLVSGTNHIEFPDSSAFDSINTNNAVTVSMWIKWSGSTEAYNELIGRYGNAANAGGSELLLKSNGKLAWYVNNAGNNIDGTGINTLVTGTWYYVAAVYSTAGGKTYVNGAQDASVGYGSACGTSDNNPMQIGHDQFGSGRYFRGYFDEARISNIVRSPAWINASYNTMNTPDLFLAFGPQEKPNVAPTQSNPSPSNGVTGVSLNPQLAITISDANSDTMNVTFRTNATGAWANIGSNNSVNNGTYRQTPSDMDSYNTEYWWSVNLTDGTLWTNTTYSFTTYSLLTIRPNAVGRSTQLTAQGAGNNWECVDELNQNGDTDYVYSDSEATYINDTYNLTDHTTQTGNINFVRIYLCGRENGSVGVGADNSMKPVIYTNNNYYDSDTAVTLTDSFVTSSWAHNVNPITSVAWTWSEIDDLEVGVALIGEQRQYSNCTQVYVEVVYTPS